MDALDGLNARQIAAVVVNNIHQFIEVDDENEQRSALKRLSQLLSAPWDAFAMKVWMERFTPSVLRYLPDPGCIDFFEAASEAARTSPLMRLSTPVTESFREFWFNVRTATRFLAPRATADSPRLDSVKIERALRAATIWFTPKSVKGFNRHDFLFLTVDEQTILANSVGRFLEIARQVPPDQPADAEQIQRALPDFLHILEVLRPDKYADPEALVIGKKVEQKLAGRFPPALLELRFETGEDASGELALWIWVVVKDEAATKEVFLPNTRALRKLLEDALAELRVERWPYIRFRTAAELRPLDAASKK